MTKIDNFFESIKDKKVAFCGLGISNFPVMEMFVNKGIDVTACDRRNFEEIMLRKQKNLVLNFL